jgi:hypothetical protein
MPSIKFPRCVVILSAPLLAALAAGCHSHVGPGAPGLSREQAVLSDWQPPTGQACQVAPTPVTLPTVVALLDTSTMPAYLEQGGIETASGSTLFSIRFDSSGRPVRVRVIESTMPERFSSTLRQAVASAIQPQGPGKGYRLRLRVDLGPTRRYQVGRSETCPPVLNYSGTYAEAPPHPGDISDRTVDKRIQEVRFTVLVGDDGAVLAVKLATGIGNPDFEAAMEKYLMKEHWKPGLDDRVPVAMSVVRTERITSETRIRRVM